MKKEGGREGQREGRKGGQREEERKGSEFIKKTIKTWSHYINTAAGLTSGTSV